MMEYYHLTMHTLNYDSCAEARRVRLLRDAKLAEERRRESRRSAGYKRAVNANPGSGTRHRNLSGKP